LAGIPPEAVTLQVGCFIGAAALGSRAFQDCCWVITVSRLRSCKTMSSLKRRTPRSGGVAAGADKKARPDTQLESLADGARFDELKVAEYCCRSTAFASSSATQSRDIDKAAARRNRARDSSLAQRQNTAFKTLRRVRFGGRRIRVEECRAHQPSSPRRASGFVRPPVPQPPRWAPASALPHQ
jgi:hypothetical protein